MKEVETLRGQPFLKTVPVYQVSEKELRVISDHELDRDYPGEKLRHYEELQAWLGMIPANTDLKAANAAFFVQEVAGLYDSEKKEMCIPWSVTGTNFSARKPADKKLQQVAPQIDGILLAHEFTHALEDQHWPLDDPKDNDTKLSTDRGTAHDFVLEGTATRIMIEAVPADSWSDSSSQYFLIWNLIHSAAGEFAINSVMRSSWKGSEALTDGVPDTLARSEAMPYAYGYSYCSKIMRDWGLDGLDYAYNHPAISSQQVMHPKKGWAWRAFPVQIDLPEPISGGWKQVSIDTLGEAGVAVLLGSSLKNLNYGLDVARDWKGDHAALYQQSSGHKLIVWASAWNSTMGAARFMNACVRERVLVNGAITAKQDSNHVEWTQTDGRTEVIYRNGKQVILIESDNQAIVQNSERIVKSIRFTPPPEDAIRSAANPPFLRFNPLISYQKDAEYAITRSLGGLLSRHDRNSIGASDRFLFGLGGELRRTKAFEKWQIGGGLIMKHESDARRGTEKTTVLPWGVLTSGNSARLPQAPNKIISHSTVLWGLVASDSKNGERESTQVLPFGLLFRRNTAPDRTSTYILGTGWTRKAATSKREVLIRWRFLGIPL